MLMNVVTKTKGNEIETMVETKEAIVVLEMTLEPTQQHKGA